VLDVAAAPGSKATQAALATPQGHITACESDSERLALMEQVIAKQNLSNVTCVLTDGREVGAKYPAQFSQIILDAPCSGEGMFGQRPHLLKDWDPSHIAPLEQLQIELLHSAWQALKPGGTLVYSTCSYNPEENEAVLTSLLKTEPSATVEPITITGIKHHNALTEWQGLQFDPRLKNAIRLYPWDNHSIGFFLAKLRKAA
jgi:16S rRNA C967 or C1407 C5-methylase (RsmB/RsmF family)